MLVHSQMRQELVDFRLTHLRRVTLPVEEDEPPDPGHVGLLSARAVMSGTDGLADSVEELGVRVSCLKVLRFCDCHGTK